MNKKRLEKMLDGLRAGLIREIRVWGVDEFIGLPDHTIASHFIAELTILKIKAKYGTLKERNE